MLNQNEIIKICDKLSVEYGNKKDAFLNYNKPYELMIAVILSAQCKDTTVNAVTANLFKKYPTIESFASADIEILQNDIRSCGLSNRKAQYIIEATSRIVKYFNGTVPATMKDLLSLSGVGRKSANVLLMSLYEIDAIPVDTHVERLSNRIGIAEGSAIKVERQIRERVPQDKWNTLTRQLIQHGRTICDAKRPKCNGCILNDICEYNKE